MSRLYAEIAVAVLCGLLALGLYTTVQRNHALTTQNNELVLSAKELTARLVRTQVLVQRATTAATAARGALDKALEQNKEWAAGPVPAAVVSSLCGTLRCADAIPVPTPHR